MTDTTNDTPEIEGTEARRNRNRRCRRRREKLRPRRRQRSAPWCPRTTPVLRPRNRRRSPHSWPSSFPGLGHLYTWAYERAFMIWATIAVCVLLIIQGSGASRS